jgi:hypothetical protein
MRKRNRAAFAHRLSRAILVAIAVALLALALLVLCDFVYDHFSRYVR